MRKIESPRLAAELTPFSDPILEEGADWTAVDVSGDLGGPQEVAGVELFTSRLANVRLTGRRLNQVRLVDVLFEDCELSGVTMTEAHFTRVEFRRCRLSGLVASALKARHVRFVDCKADGATFRMTAWDHVEFSAVDLRDADFHAARLTGARFVDCDLTRADFAKASMAGTGLHGSVLEGVKGADGLRGVVLGSDQVLSLAFSVFAALGISVDDDPLNP